MCLSINCCPKNGCCACCCGKGDSDGSHQGFLKTSYRVRLYYASLFILAAILGLALRDFDLLLDNIPSLRQDCDTAGCKGKQAVFRIGFATSFFFGCMTAVTLGKGNPRSGSPRAALHIGFWTPKILIFFLLIFVTFFMPNDFFIGFAYFATVGAGIFIILQIILLVDFAYTVNETLVGYADTDEEYEKQWLGLVLFLSGILYCGFFAFIIFMYVFMTKDGCHLNNTFITITLLLCIIVTLIGTQTEHGSILVSGLVCCYCGYLCFSALVSQPVDLGCTDFGSDGSTTTLLVGFFFAIISVSYATLSASKRDDLFNLDEQDVADQTGGPLDEEGKAIPVENQGPMYSYSWFHFIFLMGSLYVVMLLVNWNIFGNDDPKFQTDQGLTAMWIKWISMLLTLILYGWSLIAPKVLENREF